MPHRPTLPMRVRIEQGIAFGSSVEHICAQLGVTPELVADVRAAMDAAVADDPEWVAELPDVPYDEVIVAALCNGRAKVLQGGGRPNPDRDEAVRRLAAAGQTDREIGERIGMTTAGVMAARKRNGIPAGRVRTGMTGEPTWNSLIRSREHHKRRARAA